MLQAGAYAVIHMLNAHLSTKFFAGKEEAKDREAKKGGRVLRWQTQSVMQDYTVSFSTAIDVVFMGETQGFSKGSGP